MASTSEDGYPSNSQTSTDLRSTDVFRRAKATLRLGRHADPQALDQLLASLTDPEWLVVKAALQSLRRFRDPRIVVSAQAILRRENYYSWTFSRGIAIAHAATRALRSQGEEGFQALLALLREAKGEEVRGQIIARQLAVLRDPRAIEPLIACFDSPVYEVANSAANNLRFFGEAAISPLVAAMSSTDMSVFDHVASALRRIGAPAVPALLNALRHAEDENIRAGAADVLDMADSEEVREALRAALEDPDADVRRMAMWSLGDFGDPRVLDQLLVEQPGERPGSLQPASTIAHIGGVAVPPLIEALVDQARPTYQRVNAARALGLIEDKRAVEPLIAALRDDDENVRAAAVSTLGDFKDARAVEPLLAALHDSSATVRERAAHTLAPIEDDRAFDAAMRYVREAEEGDRSASGVLLTLAAQHGERALPLLREMALGSDFRRSLSARVALSRLGAVGVSVLLEIGRDPRPERCHTAITWLKMAYHRSPDPRIVEFLFEVIQKNPTSVVAESMRYQAALALAECGDPRAVEPLLELLQEAKRHRAMRNSAVWSLGELGDEQVLSALTSAYEATMAGEDGTDVGERSGREYEFQDALLSAIKKIRARLSMK